MQLRHQVDIMYFVRTSTADKYLLNYAPIGHIEVKFVYGLVIFVYDPFA